MHFFLGGFVLFGTAIGLMVGWATWYDGAMSLIGWIVGAVSIAVISMVVALLSVSLSGCCQVFGRGGSRTAS